jgi:uncharacterized membrane protein HdeD (DUF308 family)
MDKTTVAPAAGQAKNPLSYVLIALGILLLAMGVPVLFATSQVSRLIGDSLGQGPVMAVLGLVIVVSGATMLAIGLRRR